MQSGMSFEPFQSSELHNSPGLDLLPIFVFGHLTLSINNIFGIVYNAFFLLCDASLNLFLPCLATDVLTSEPYVVLLLLSFVSIGDSFYISWSGLVEK